MFTYKKEIDWDKIQNLTIANHKQKVIDYFNSQLLWLRIKKQLKNKKNENRKSDRSNKNNVRYSLAHENNWELLSMLNREELIQIGLNLHLKLEDVQMLLQCTGKQQLYGKFQKDLETMVTIKRNS